mmetsp:Transcript_1201/g.2929  ORF Transcript_1201/g.2929 Transcript_1201/m.2929 type:complete len:344 (+) Transcript_1201:73-1104(+)
MEKYRQFADGGTGVNPFVPLWSNRKSPLALRAAKYLVLFPIVVLRLSLLFVAALILALGELLGFAIPLGILRYPVYRLVTYVGCCLALFALGVIPTSESLADYRRLKLAPPKTTTGASPFDARRGMLVFANQQGMTDVLYLGMKLCPTFVFAASDGTTVACSLLAALSRASSIEPLAPLPKASQLTLAQLSEEARSSWKGPVVVFPEGARTTGNCVLRWGTEAFAGMEALDKLDIAVVSLVYSKTGDYTPHHTVGTPLWHIFNLVYQPWHTLSATWLSSTDVAIGLRGKAFPEQVAFLRTLLVRMIQGAVEVETSSSVYFDFTAFWDAAQRKHYTQKEKKKSR